VIILVEITKETRTRGNTLRPDITLPKDVWDGFKKKYRSKWDRDKALTRLIKKDVI